MNIIHDVNLIVLFCHSITLCMLSCKSYLVAIATFDILNVVNKGAI